MPRGHLHYQGAPSKEHYSRGTTAGAPQQGHWSRGTTAKGHLASAILFLRAHARIMRAQAEILSLWGETIPYCNPASPNNELNGLCSKKRLMCQRTPTAHYQGAPSKGHLARGTTAGGYLLGGAKRCLKERHCRPKQHCRPKRR